MSRLVYAEITADREPMMRNAIDMSLSFGRCGPVLRCVVAGLLIGAATPGWAQFYGSPFGYGGLDGLAPYNRPPAVFRGTERPMNPADIVDRLEDAGFDDVGRPRFNGSVYVVEANNRRGQRERIVLDAFRGTVVERRLLASRDDDDVALGSGGPFRDRVEPRGWFGNNLRPPEEYRQYGGRPSDDAPDEDDRAGLPTLRRQPDAATPPGVVPRPRGPGRTSALPATPAPTAPDAPAPGGGVAPPAAERPQPRPTTSRTPDSTVEGLNPAGKPDAVSKQAPSAAERSGQPEPNRAFEGRRSASTKPDSGLSPVRPLGSPKAPVASGPDRTASDPGSSVTVDAPRPERSVRVIQGVTPLGAAPASPPGANDKGVPRQSPEATTQSR